MSAVIGSFSHSERWGTHQYLLQLFRDFDALQRVRPYLVPSSLANRRLEREQAEIEAAMASVRRAAREDH